MTLYDALNLPPAFLVMLGLIALAIACISVGVYFFGEEGIVAKTANFVAMAGLLMVLVFVIFFGHLINDAYLTELATGLGFDVRSISWGILNVCSGLMWASGGNLLNSYADEGERRDGYWLIGLGVALVLLGLTRLGSPVLRLK